MNDRDIEVTLRSQRSPNGQGPAGATDDEPPFPPILELPQPLPDGKPYIYTSEGYVHESLLTPTSEWHMTQETMDMLRAIGAQIVFNEVWRLGDREVKRSAHVLSMVSIPFAGTIGADPEPYDEET